MIKRRSKYISGHKTRNTRKKISVIFVLFLIIAVVFIFNKNTRGYYHITRAKHFILNNKFEKAKVEFEKADKLIPDNPDLLDGIGFLNIQLNDFEKALHFYSMAEKNKNKLSGKFNHIKFGNKFIDEAEYKKALIEFKHSIFLSRQKFKAHIGLAISYQGIGEINQCIEEFKKALVLDPGNKYVKAAIERAFKIRNRGTITYIVDRNFFPLAKWNIENKNSIYPSGYVSAHITGFRSKKRGITGIEEFIKEYVPGVEIRLTIDSKMQEIAEKYLGGYKGSVVIIDPKTGEILACVNHPTFNPNKIEEDTNWNKIINNRNNPFLNRAFEGLYEPGSICKIISIASLLESNLNYEKLFPFNCPGYSMIDGKISWDWQKHNEVKDIEQAFGLSCNVAFAKIGTLLEKDRIYTYARNFGFEKNLLLPVKVAESKLPVSILSKKELSEFATGLGTGYLITPLNACIIASSIANNGIIMKPMLIKEIRNVKGEIIKKFKPEKLNTAIKKDTAKKLTKMMIETVAVGTGSKAFTTDIEIAGKTGTTGSARSYLNGWFICFAPAKKPKIAIAVFIEKGGTGMDVAAPRAGKIIAKILGENKK